LIEFPPASAVVDGARPAQAADSHRLPQQRRRVEWPPNAKQLIAHASPAEQIFYGGAAGGGKSIWLVVALVGFAATHPNVQVAIFRRHYKELHQSIVPMVLSMLPRGTYRFDKQLGRLEFPHNNSIVWFLHCARESDVILYQSSNWRKLGIDEASHMTQFIVDYLTTRVRGDYRQAQVLLGSNPGGPGHGWLKRRFVRPTGLDVGPRPSPRPLEVWRPYPPREKPDQYMMSRVFIPAFVQDNVEMVKADPHYFDRILALGGAKARQLAYGDWDSNDGMMFGPDWEAEHIVSESDTTLLTLGFHPQQIIPWHVIPRSDWRPPQSATIFGSIDYGYGAPWSFHLHAILPGGHIRTFFEFYRAGIRDRVQAEMIRTAIGRLMEPVSAGGCHMQRPQWLVYDPQMDNTRERGRAHREHQRRLPAGPHGERPGRAADCRREVVAQVAHPAHQGRPGAVGRRAAALADHAGLPGADSYVAGNADRPGRPGGHRRGCRGSRLGGVRPVPRASADSAAGETLLRARRARPAQSGRAARRPVAARRGGRRDTAADHQHHSRLRSDGDARQQTARGGDSVSGGVHVPPGRADSRRDGGRGDGCRPPARSPAVMVEDRPQPMMHGYSSADGKRSAFMFREERGTTWTVERHQGSRQLSTTKGLSSRDARWACVEWTR
jgi:hypothetical protein